MYIFLNECVGVILLLLFCTIFLSDILINQFSVNVFCSFSSHSSHLIRSHQLFVVFFLQSTLSFPLLSITCTRAEHSNRDGWVCDGIHGYMDTITTYGHPAVLHHSLSLLCSLLSFCSYI